MTTCLRLLHVRSCTLIQQALFGPLQLLIYAFCNIQDLSLPCLVVNNCSPSSISFMQCTARTQTMRPSPGLMHADYRWSFTFLHLIIQCTARTFSGACMLKYRIEAASRARSLMVVHPLLEKGIHCFDAWTLFGACMLVVHHCMHCCAGCMDPFRGVHADCVR